ncbi:MAG TPA: MFS transporter, partial [Planctomycetia bacterium]|nr:MFS transporter [Planctomycetia bacterium]
MADSPAASLESLQKEPNVPTTHPKAFFFFFWGEFAERCSYYGMRAILPIFLTTVIALPEKDANTYYAWFKAACYLLPLLGGFLADRYFGKYWTIVGFSIPYIIGQFLLGLNSTYMTYLALVLLACGSGVIKPNISTLMGLTYDQQRPGRLALRSAAFQWFYFSINVGALISMAVLPELRDHWAKQAYMQRTGVATLPADFQPAKQCSKEDFSAAYPPTFMFPAVLMILALGAFAGGKKHYAVEKIGAGAPASPEEKAEQRSVLLRLLGLFLIMTFYWVPYEHNDSLWVFFARDHMNMTLNFFGASKTFAPDGLQWVNSLCVLLFIPFFNYFWPKVDPAGTRFPPTSKMLIGFVFTAAAAGMMAILGYMVGPETKVSAWWLVFAYVILTLGEVLIYGTGLELAFTAAPANMKGFVTACFLTTNTLGNLVNSVWTRSFTTNLAPDSSSGLP